MKMPRSQCEADNIQFVQELAEVDGPFESPININFRDLTKLELPSLIWNRSDTCPKKMKITNTGHTVILSGKWKCERPYLTGGPLCGKYVFSQIHFHWGQDDCRGSEHQVCGDGFPLEMHVAHFKTEYLTQENALREKDGMVVVVYLFKLQDEPNQSLKKIISLLPCVKQPSTSHAIDPLPILSFCNPFTDDYFMYWGSVVTSTCAHILLWIICREPFGISRDQVNEFRKIMDSCQQPICRNNRDIQPLHKRNVFHVNASKHLDNPLLPLKKILGCYCKERGGNNATNNRQDCKCQSSKNQEECEGDAVEYMSGKHYSHIGGVKPMHLKVGLPNGCFLQNQTYFVQRATVHSVSLELQRFGSEPGRNHRRPENSRQLNPEDNLQSKLVSKSCCFLPVVDCSNNKTDKRKTRGKRRFNSSRAFSQIMHSLEAIKNHTFKKLKEIESINQEIKGMKSYCQGSEDKQWLRKIEKMIKRHKRFTIRSSQGCLSELKKLAKDCNLDKIFDCKALPVNEHTGKLVWLYNDDLIRENFCSPNVCLKQFKQENREKETSKHLNIDKVVKFSAKAQKLIQSFFEDIKDTDDLHETVKKDLKLQKIKSICSKQAGDSNSVSSVIKGFITPNMFQSGNLGDRFFTEVSTEDFENDESQWGNTKKESKIRNNAIVVEEIGDDYEVEKTERAGTETNRDENLKSKNEAHGKKNLTGVVSRTSAKDNDTDTVLYGICDLSDEGDNTEIPADIESKTGSKKKQKTRKKHENFFSNLFDKEKKLAYESTNQKLLRETKPEYGSCWKTRMNSNPSVRCSTSDTSTESTQTQRMIIAKIRRRRSKRDSWERNSSDPGGKSFASLNEKKSCKEIEGYYIHKKNLKTKKRKKQKDEHIILSGSSSREQSRVKANKWKNLTKAKFKLEIEKTSESFVDLAFDNSMISPKKKRQKLESQKGSSRTPRESNRVNPTDDGYRDEDMLTIEARLKKDNEVSHSAEESSPKARHQWQDVRRTSIDRWIRASSIDSKTSSIGRKETEDSYPVLQAEKDTLNVETLKYSKTKSAFKSRSLTGITQGSKISTEVTQRLYLESLDDRRKNNREVSDLRRYLESPNKTAERSQTKKDLSYEISTDNYFSEGRQNQEEAFENKGMQDSNTLEYNVGFFTTASSQADDELLPKGQEDNVQNKVLKRCDVEKYQFLEKRLDELTTSFQEGTEEYPEIFDQKDSKSKDASKGDTDVQNIVNKDLQSCVSYLKLKKSSPSRPHSAETLTSLTKTVKRKSKKRPHCCKRISRHYIRKNSSIFKKPNKTESKPQNFQSLTNEEQLKIISVNVAKYLKQKLIEGNKGLDPGKTSIENIEEAVFTKLKAVQEKKEEKPQKATGANKEEKTKQNRLPILKSREKKKEKLTRSESKIKTKPLTSPKEPKNEKPVSALPKPVNNFIKLNKQMAGKYKKKAIPFLDKNVELKQKEKQRPYPERETKEESVKFKTKIPKKLVEKTNSQSVPEKTKSRPETPLSPKSQKQSPKRKETKFKSLVPTKKTDAKNKNPSTISLPNDDKSKQLVAAEESQAESTVTSFALQTSPEMKKHVVSDHTPALTSHLPAPTEIVDSQQRKVNPLSMNNPDLDLPDVIYDKSKILTEGNDTVFKKELEYFIKLEMLDISTKIEKSMNYVKSTISQDFGSNFRENTSPDDQKYLDSYNKEIVLLKMKDMECSSSCSEILENVDKYTLGRDLTGSKNKNLNKINNINTVKVPKESGDPGIINQKICHQLPIETTSDSSYDCKISITLNTNTNREGEEQNMTEETIQNSEGDSEMPDRDVYGCQAGNSKSQTLNCVDRSSSQSLIAKHNRRKRKENEISLEMKQKLLEILEGEIRREIGLLCEVSSGNSSEGLTLKRDDSEANNRSTGSSCDNVEILTQISDTMRQYLKSLKDKGQLVEILNVSSDKEIK